MKKTEKITKGFTIIEVVLVLAIAGLIFMMVFIALPSLQRSQRDTQRSNDIARMSTAVNNYQANNRGKIPSDTGAVTINETTGKADESNGAKGWAKFYNTYLIVNAGGSTDTFEDPDGEPYSLYVDTCAPSAQPKVGDTCQTSLQRGNESSITFDDQSEGGSSVSEAGDVPNHAIIVALHATCDGDTTKYSSGSRKVAMTYKKEGGGAICVNN